MPKGGVSATILVIIKKQELGYLVVKGGDILSSFSAVRFQKMQ